MSADGYVIAILGAGSEVGREVAAVLRERALPISEWRLYDDPPDDATFDADESGAEILPLAALDLEGTDVVFLCGGAGQGAEWAERAASAGTLAIDLTQSLAETDVAPLVVPEVNPGAVADGVERGVLACPVPSAIALAVALKPIDTAAELKRVVVASFEPVSGAGREGIDELVRQSRDLLSGASTDSRVFARRIAFNVIPQIGDFLPGGRTRHEWLIESQTRRVLEVADLPITVTSVTIPVFFGQACAVHVETERPLDAAAARQLLRQAPGVLLSEETGPDDYPTLADVIGSEATHVGRVRDDPTVPYGLALWIAIDGLRKGAAVNAVQIAELALRGVH
jgi:aspartate-semialdehyde dehydrogenase